jgi:hypothetical protein
LFGEQLDRMPSEGSVYLSKMYFHVTHKNYQTVRSAAQVQKKKKTENRKSVIEGRPPPPPQTKDCRRSRY